MASFEAQEFTEANVSKFKLWRKEADELIDKLSDLMADKEEEHKFIQEKMARLISVLMTISARRNPLFLLLTSELVDMFDIVFKVAFALGLHYDKLHKEGNEPKQ